MKHRKMLFSLNATLLISILVLITCISAGNHVINTRNGKNTANNPKHLLTWSSSFIFNNQSYAYTMIGTNPVNGSATTTIPITIIPLEIALGNVIYDGSEKVTEVISSPIFQNASFESGHTQYIDAIQRAEFWSLIQKDSPEYHILLQKPAIEKTVKLEVPSDYGSLIMIKGYQYGNISNSSWWKQQLQQILEAYQGISNGLAIFLTNNIVINRGIAGFHGVTGRGTPSDVTYAWASLFNHDFSPSVADVAPLSHELAEWANDPYANNNVPSWILPGQIQYGCMHILEVADPLVGTVFTMNGYTLQDVAFFSWFMHQPSIGYSGYYSYLGTFKTHPGTIVC